MGPFNIRVPTEYCFHKGLFIMDLEATAVWLPRSNVIQSFVRHFAESAMQLLWKGGRHACNVMSDW
jgi:hypothetical protein